MYEMALRSTTKSYKSISRPSLSGSFSSYASSLAAKQKAAEDLIKDNQYANGEISDEVYLSYLQERLTRPTLSPSGVESLRQKIQTVTEKANDARIANGVANGSITTQQQLDYEKEKLTKMPAANSAAYQQQAKVVQNLTDKVEREARAAYRTKENLRISQLPEDTSVNLEQKAQLYARLEQQARLDGDTQTADTLATSKNNYLEAAKRANINDLITNTRQSVSQTLPGGLGVPSSDGGSQVLQSLTGQKIPSGSSTSAGATVPANGIGVSAGGGSLTKTFATGGNSGAVQSALKRLDAAQNSLDRIAAQKADATSMLSAYDAAIAQATGDQKTQLTIARNNLVSQVASLDNQTQQTYASIQDTVDRINELQQKAALSNFRKSASTEMNALNLQEKKLEQDLATGKIDKAKYLFEAASLTGARIALNTDISAGYRQFGEDDKADEIDQAIQELSSTRPAQIYQTLTEGVSRLGNDPKKADAFIKQTIGAIGNNYELIRTQKDGTLNNISGKTLKKGDISLVDVSLDKQNGTFQKNYVRDGGVYAAINYPQQKDELTGGTRPAQRLEDLIAANTKPYIIGADGQAKAVKFIEIQRPGGVNDIIPQTEEFIKKSGNMYVADPASNGLKYTIKQNVQPPKSLLDNLPAMDNPFTNPNTYGGQVIKKAGDVANAVGDAIKSFLPGSWETINGQQVYFPFRKKTQQQQTQSANPITGFIQAGAKTVADAAGNIAKTIAKTIVPQAYARGDMAPVPKDQQWRNSPQVVDRTKIGTSADVKDYDAAVRQAAAESGIPEAVIRAMGAAETNTGDGRQSTGYAKRNNFFNIGAFDSNPDNAYEYATPLEGVRALTKLLSGDPRYAKAYAARTDPIKMVQEIAKAGYASNPNYAKLVMGTPEFKNSLAISGNATSQPNTNLRSTTTPKASTTTLRSTTATPTAAAAYQPPPPDAYQQQGNFASPIPDSQRVVSIGSGIKSPTSTAVAKPASFSIPQIKIPQISIPKPITQTVNNVVKTVQSAPQNIIKTVQNAVSSAGNYLKNLFKW